MGGGIPSLCWRACTGAASVSRSQAEERAILAQGPPLVIYPTLATIRGTALGEAGRCDHRSHQAGHPHRRIQSTGGASPQRTPTTPSILSCAVYSMLVEYCTTGERQPINFTEAAYGVHIPQPHENHCRHSSPKALGQVFHRLYLETTETRSVQPSAGSSATLIDIPGADA
ncbi:hypothetical protein B0H14DRAFT_2598711 [Mycena olivaceomarginata]|nr:hypothetical protein B0H14DRAFT_2598711 [Mycena olivaceomarginata]